MSDPHGLGCSIQLAIDIRVAHDRLHILAGFGEWNGFHELLDVTVLPYGLPVFYTIVTRVVCSKGIFESAKLIHHRAEVAGSQLQVNRGSEKLWRRKGLELHLLFHSFADSRQQFHK